MPDLQKKTQQKIALYIFISSLFAAINSPFALAQNPFKGNSSTKQQTLFTEAFDNWMLRAYEGDRDAQFKVALMLSDGTGTTKDIEQAVYWYIQAARQGLASAQYNLGHKYLSGEGTIKEATKAVSWWRKAAEQDHELAQFNIARAYYSGIGVTKDEQRAKYWFQRAASNDEARSRKILADVFNMPATQIGAIVSRPEPSLDANSSVEVMVADNTITQAEPQVVATSSRYQPIGEVLSISEPVEIDHAQIIETVQQGGVIQQNEIIQTTESTQTAEPTSHNLIVYNKPRANSAVISEMDVSLLQVVKKTANWAQVKSSNGLPVWVYDTYVTIDGDTATITGDNVNARATPFVLRGSVVGQFFKGNKAPILEVKDNWVRVQSPKNFVAWVKRMDFAKATGTNNAFIAVNKKTAPITTPIKRISMPTKLDAVARPSKTVAKVTDSYSFKNETNDNEWLFSQPENTYTLQLASFSDDLVLEKFIKNRKLANDSRARQFISNRNNIEWKYILYGAFDSREVANTVKTKKGFKKAWVRNIGQIRKNRCVAWKTTLPTPKELKTYCQ